MRKRRSLPELAMNRPVTVSMLVITLIGLGVIAAQRTAVEFLPPMDLPFLGAFIPYFGATPAQVEQEIAIPAEGQFRTLPNLNQMYTNSSSDGCFISLNFEWGTDMTDALAEVRDRMERLRLVLPENADRIMVRHFSLDTIPVMQIGLSHEGDFGAFADLVDREVVDKLLRLDGVADVEVFGHDERMIMIDLDQQSMLAHDVSLYELILKLNTANVDAGVGQLNDGDTKYHVRTLSPVTSLGEYANLNLNHGLRLGDVAQGSYRARDPEYHFSIDGRREMFLIITKDSEANTAAMCADVIAELDRILESPVMEGTEKLVFFNQGAIIVGALNGLKQAAAVGGIMALLVLLTFLRRIRATIIVALAIPGSIVAAFVFMFASGMTLNLITMMSMIVAIGMVVDNSIVVIENIYRHRDLGKGAHESARDGASEVSLAIIAATSTTAVVFLPVFYMQSGPMAVFTRQFAVPVTVSLGASLVLALTVIPLAVSRFKHYEGSPMERYRRWSDAESGERPKSVFKTVLNAFRRVSPIVAVRNGYVRLLAMSMRNRLATTAILVGIVWVTIEWPLQNMPFQAIPDIDGRVVEVDVKLDPNFDMAMAGELFDEVGSMLDARRDELGIKNVLKNYTVRGGELTMFLLKPEDLPPAQPFPYSTEEVVDIVWHLLPERVPGARFTVSTGMEERGAGSAQSRVSLRLEGDDTETLDEYAELLMDVLGALPELTDTRKSTERAQQEIQLKIDNVLAGHAGIEPMRVAQTVGFALLGTELSRVKSGGREISVWAQFQAEDRKSRANLDNVMLRGSSGSLVMLNQLVTSRKAETPRMINRRNGKNFVYVTASTAGPNLANVERALRGIVDSFEMPTGYSLALGDELRGLQEDQSNFFSILLLAVVLIFIVMSALFESCLIPLSILTSVPLAFLGVIWTMYLTGTPMDTIAFIGCILMVGVVVNNGIVIVDHIKNLRKEGLSRFDAIVQSGHDRIRPVLMTALTTILGATPLIAPLVFERIGQPATVSLGCALIGGLTAGTFLTLFVVPLFYTFVDDFQTWIMRYLASVSRIAKGGAGAV